MCAWHQNVCDSLAKIPNYLICYCTEYVCKIIVVVVVNIIAHLCLLDTTHVFETHPPLSHISLTRICFPCFPSSSCIAPLFVSKIDELKLCSHTYITVNLYTRIQVHPNPTHIIHLSTIYVYMFAHLHTNAHKLHIGLKFMWQIKNIFTHMYMHVFIYLCACKYIYCIYKKYASSQQKLASNTFQVKKRWNKIFIFLFVFLFILFLFPKFFALQPYVGGIKCWIESRILFVLFWVRVGLHIFASDHLSPPCRCYSSLIICCNCCVFWCQVFKLCWWHQLRNS